MRVASAVMSIMTALFLAGTAAGQAVPLLQSAETVDQGVFKLVIAPALLIGKHGANSEAGVAARAGYGFVDRFDAELKAAVYENSTWAGADVELWALKTTAVNGSITGGVHWVFVDKANDTMGFELIPNLSIPLQEGLDLYGGLNASFEKVRDAPPEIDDTFTRVHLVPGIEYSLSPEADLSGEFGIGLNDDSWHYVSFAVEFYLR